MRKDRVENPIISLDLGSDSIKMVSGMEKEGLIRVSDFASRRYPASQATAELISGQIRELIGSLPEARNIRTSRIHSLISGRKLCIRVVRLPVMPEAEIQQALKSQIRKYVSVDLERVRFSFAVLGESEEKGITKLEVVFAAIQKNLFEEYLQCFKLAGIGPQIVSTAAFSEWRLIRKLGLDRDTASVMLVNIDSQETDLAVYQKNKFIFTRNISIGSKDFTDKLKGQPRFSLQREEDVRLLWSKEEKPTLPEVKDEALLSKIREFLQNEAEMLCKEIELTAHHYYQLTHGRRIDKCIILGEGAQIGGLVEFSKQRLEMPVEALHILDEQLQLPQGKREEFKRVLPAYAQALGAMLLGGDELNLLGKAPQRTRDIMHPFRLFRPEKVKAMTSAKKVSGLVVLFLVLGIFVFSFLKGINIYQKHRIKTYKTRLDQLESCTLDLIQLRRKMDMLDSEKGMHLRLSKEYPAYSVSIARICQAIPSQRIVFDELAIYREEKAAASFDAVSPTKFNIIGWVLGEEAASQELTEFVLALEKSGHFENISISMREEVPRRAGARLTEETLLSQQLPKLSFILNGFIRMD